MTVRGPSTTSDGGNDSATAIVTFLFTDIEGSTRRWEADPNAMRGALALHDEVLRAAIEGHRGQVFKHTGDGICAAFTAPSTAVDAAVAAQRGLELPVRMGVATGEAQRRDGDYFGVVLNRAARIMAAGHGGQILIDGVTAGLVTDAGLIDLGARQLRDIAEPVRIFQIAAAGLSAEFPPLKTADRSPDNIRVPTTTLVGRTAELAELCTALQPQRLTTLIGVGGVGKTRLALEAAARTADDFPAGVWFIELAPVGDPGAVPDAVAAALGVTQQPGFSMTESIAAAMEGRPRLVILDNCEHVLDAVADLVESILARSTTVTVLATSREGLRLQGEQLWPVPPLKTQGGHQSHAAALFVERAHGVAPGISLTDSDDAAAVAEICRRLDGIPLAIELAASRVQSMTVVELRDRLDDRFRLLVGARRGLERHQTLQHAVAWSYDLLDDVEKSLLTRCSVFAGGFDLAGACVISGADDELATLDQLDALVRKSLLVADHGSRRSRYSMLETIRQFAHDRLVDSGQAEECRGAHARYFAGREADVMALWDSPRQRDSYDWLVRELPNLRAAFRWAADHGDLDTAAAIAVHTTVLGYFSQQYESVGWAEELIEPARAVGHRRLAQLYTMASRGIQTGRNESATAYAEAGLRAVESGRFDPIPFEVEAELTGYYLVIGEPEQCIALQRKAIALDPDNSIYTRGFMVINLVMTGAIDEALTASAPLRDVAAVTGNPAMLSWALLAYGFARHDSDPEAAYEVHRRGSKIAADTGNRLLETYHGHNLARLAANHGDAVEAFGFFTLVISNYLESGNSSLLAQPIALLSAYFDRIGRHEPAATLSGYGGGTPFVRDYYPEAGAAIRHLRDVLGDSRYEELESTGASMTGVQAAEYALAQIDRARADLSLPGGT